MKRALFIGRFQPFHHGHYDALKKLLKRYGEVVVVIGSSEASFSNENPFTAGERVEMIRAAFGRGELSRLILVPVPDINNNTVWVDHVLMHTPVVHEVYSNNQLVKMLFSKHGILVKSTDFFDRGTKEGAYLRKLMVEGDQGWRKHVPRKTVEYLDTIEAEKRVRKIERLG